MMALWSSKKMDEVEYDRVKVLKIYIEIHYGNRGKIVGPGEKFFLHVLLQKNFLYWSCFIKFLIRKSNLQIKLEWHMRFACVNIFRGHVSSPLNTLSIYLLLNFSQ